jgi:hypothetical protein
MGFTLDRRLWLTADHSRVVEDDDPHAAFLLGSSGKRVTDEVAKRYGLIYPKSTDDLDGLTVAELQAKADERGIEAKGLKKAELIAALRTPEES